MTTDLNSTVTMTQTPRGDRITFSISYDFTVSDLWSATSQWELRSRICRAIDRCVDSWLASPSVEVLAAPAKSSKT